ncbi:hypothetical protein K457DRAFT_22094 [Linnemannia elongata AG-77]|uniref:Uncharacterized protein n=1 Tax=Linnemannia elongata AG-77 TaxID=1314771 RepID=A0A197JPM3_9FUNG|nr:hypothetical protein K457DRAFT_22094 [Linnemannia elongata AG-77]
MDTRRANPSRHLTSAILHALGNPPTAPLPPIPPLIPVQPPQPSMASHYSSPSEAVETQTHHNLREEVTPLVRTWEPTPANILEVLRCSNVRLPCIDVLSSHEVQQTLSSSSNSLSLASSSSTPQGQRQCLLQATSTAPCAVSDSLSSASQLPASTEQNEAKSSFIKLVQPIPPQSRTFFANVPFLHRLSYAGSVDLDVSNNSSSSSSPSAKATVDPFDSDRDVLSKVYILTTSAHSAVHLASSSGQQQQQKQKHKLPPKYLLKVFPNKTPFKHAATRTDARNNNQPSPLASRAVMRTIVQSVMEHELGAIEWAQKFLRRTTTPNVLGYSLPLDRPTQPPGCGDSEGAEVTGVEKYGILGFILMELPAEGVLYQGPLEEFQTKESQQIAISRSVAKAIYEMRSASCSLRVSGFSIHRRVHADDGSSKVVDGVSKPYNRFDLIVDQLRRRDAEKAGEQLSFKHPAAFTAQNPPTLSPTSSDAREPFLYKTIDSSTNKLQADSDGTAIAPTAAKDVHQSESSMTSQSSCSASSSSTPTPVSIRSSLAPVKDSRRTSLLMSVHKKTIDRKISDGEVLGLPLSSFPSVPESSASAVATDASDDSQANVDLEVELTPRTQLDPRRQETLQGDMLQRVAKRLTSAPPTPCDALEACRRMSYPEKNHHHQSQPTTSTSLAILASLQLLAAGTMRRVREPKKPKLAIRPSSTISVSGCMRTAPYVRPMKASSPKTWPDVCFPSGATVIRQQPVVQRASCCFDADDSVYCSLRAQERSFDGRGEIYRLVAKISGDPSSFSSSSSSDPFKTSTGTETVSWPKKFVEPANAKDGKPVYNSVADYEYTRLVNALVALERLDSTPGSMNRFPKDLLKILPRILRFVHQKDMLFSHNPRMNHRADCNRGKQAPVRIGNPAQQTAFFSPPDPPGLFEGIESVFTHGQLAAQGSLVTDRKRRDVVAVANFQKAGFLPLYEENMKGLFVKKVSSSFWNVPTDGSDDTEINESGGGNKAQNRMHKTASKVWPFKRFSKLSTFNSNISAMSPTATAIPLGSCVEECDEDDVHVAAQFTMPARSISIHGKHPAPYPLLNHAIEHGSSCGNRYMVLVEANSPNISSTSTSTSLMSSLTAASLATDSSPAQGLNAPKQFSVVSSGLTSNQITVAPSLVDASVSDSQGDRDAIVAEKSGSFRQMKSQFKARFLSKSKKNKSKRTYGDKDGHDDDEQDPGWVMIEELIQDPASDELFSLSPLVGTTTATTATTATAATNSPALERFPFTSSALIPGPEQPPRRPLTTDLPTFPTTPSSLSLSLSLPQSANSARSTTSQGTLLPEEPKICQVGWKHFLKTYGALEAKALEAAAAAATESNSTETNNYSSTAPPPPSPSSSPTTTPISFSVSTITFKESTYSHRHQLRALTDTVNNRSNSLVALESLVSLSKTLQNLVVVLEAGGIVLTPEQLLVTISERQKAWQRSEEKRLAQIESQKEAERKRRIEAGERQEREQEERMAALKLLREQLEQPQKLQQPQQQQQEEEQQQLKGKASWWQDDEIREIPPEVPPKDDPPAAPFKNKITLPSTSGADTEIDTDAGVGSAEAALSRIKSPRFGYMLKPPSFLQKQAIVASSTATPTTSTPVVLRRLSHLLGLSPQPQPSSLTTSSVTEGSTASTASEYHYQGRTPGYCIRSPDDDILYSAPGLQRDPLPSELPDHILASTSMGPAIASSPTSRFDPTAVYETDFHHKLGTMIAPGLPAYGVRMTNPDGTKTLAQVEIERIEREMLTFWRGLEALCEYEGRTSRCAPPGIALLSMEELERQVEDVERWVTETKEGHRSSLSR